MLPGGMRLVCCPAVSPAEYFGVAVNAGSRDEQPGEYGLAHFVEHTIFKGTARRRPHHIINRMESVGGELNAFTSKEETYVYSAFPAGNLPRAMELVADLMQNSVFPAAELDRERSVVGEEIDACFDTPAERVYDDFEDMVFAGSQLGHNILGSADTLAGFSSEGCRRWIERNYTAGRMTAFYYGAVARRACAARWSGCSAMCAAARLPGARLRLRWLCSAKDVGLTHIRPTPWWAPALAESIRPTAMPWRLW